MCIIIVKQKTKKVSLSTLKNCSKINPHGLGIVWLDTFKVEYHKSNMYKLLDTERPFIAHFRYATIGAINKSNMHPFKCGRQFDELLMMNGTIRSLGNDKESDTKVLARQLGDIARPKWKQELAKYDCRFVTINTRTRSFQIYNRESWVYNDGVWYSKGNVLKDNVIAVYGTLKKGFGNYFNYLTSAKHIGRGKTTDKYPLIVRGLPYMINEKGVGHNVVVDVFAVSDMELKAIDRLEQHPNWYRRERVSITMDKSGKQKEAWLYFNLRETHIGHELHESYEVKPRPISNDYFSRYNEYDICDAEIIGEQMDIFDEEFMVEEESPICIGCYHDLEYDGYGHYFCQGCQGWFTENEILKSNY